MSAVRIGVLASGGDAQRINATVRAVVCMALTRGAQPYTIYEGWQGACMDGDSIRKMEWSDVSSILAEGDMMIGTARSADFRTCEGRHRAAANLLEHGIGHLIVIGGDGSLSGTSEFRGKWTQHVVELAAGGVISPEATAEHPALIIVDLVDSIDSDLVGTDMTIGVNTALRHVLDAIDQLTSTAASYQHTFVIEVMGCHYGYLPLMATIAGGTDYVFTPGDPADPGWQDELAEHLRLGCKAGRREPIILVVEGAYNHDGNELSTQLIADTVREHTGEDARVTALSHVQRGGTPSAYDRWMSVLLGYATIQEILASSAEDEPVILSVRRNRITHIPLMKAVHDMRAIRDLIAADDYTAAQALHGSSSSLIVGISQILSAPPQLAPEPTDEIKRVAILHTGGLAPGMNAMAHVVVHLGITRGQAMLGVNGSRSGLADDRMHELSWSDMEGQAFKGGAELGTKRDVPPVKQFYAPDRTIERNRIDVLLVIGDMNAYLGVHAITSGRDRYPALQIPILLIPASIDNNLPGCEFATGTDTAINSATWAIDRVKESAAASKRYFITETMRHHCDYLTLMSALSSGTGYMYINEESPSLEQIAADADRAVASLKSGQRLFLMLLNESASQYYDHEFLADVFSAESEGVYDVRRQAPGHMQQDGSPSSYGHLLATHLVARTFEQLLDQFERGGRDACYIGQVGNAVETRPVKNIFGDLDIKDRRPFVQWWRDLVPAQHIVSLQNPGVEATPIPTDDPVA